MKLKFNSKIELCEVHHVGIITRMVAQESGENLKALIDLIKVVLQPHDGDYLVRVSNSGKSILVDRSKDFTEKLNIEGDFLLITKGEK